MAQPSTQEARFSLVADLQSRDGGVTKDARMHNAFAEKDGRAWQRPVLGSGVAAGSGVAGQGLVVDGSTVYNIAGGTLYYATPGFSLTPGTNAAGGLAALFNGGMYRIDLGTGFVYRSRLSGLSWLTVSTAGVTVPNPGQGPSIWEAGGQLWGYFDKTGSAWNVYKSTDAITWGTALVTGESTRRGFMVGFGASAYRYPTTFTNGATFFQFGTGATGTLSFPAATSLVPNLTGTGGGFVWVLGSGASNVLLARSSDGTSFSLAGTGTLALPAATNVGRMGYTANSLLALVGTGTVGAVLSIPPTGAWSTIGTFGSPLGTAVYKTILPGSVRSYALAAFQGQGVQGTLGTAGTLGPNTSLASVDLSVSPQGVVRSRTNNYLVMQGTTGATLYNTANGTSGAVTGLPTNMVPGLVYLDATYYVMDITGTIWNSTGAGDDPTTWPASGFITASFEPSPGVALAKALNYVVALKSWSTELFWDAGNPTNSPLSPVNNGVILIGCASAGGVAATESTLIWIAQRKGGSSSAQAGRFVAMLIGTSYEELSTPSVNRILDADDLNTVYAAVAEIGGHAWLILGLGTTGITLVADLKNKGPDGKPMWYTWSRLAAGAAQTVTSLIQTNGIATGTAVSHGFNDGDPVVVGGTSAGFTGTFAVNVPNSSSFTYPVSLTGTSTATGGLTATGYTESFFDVVAVAGLGGTQLVQDSSGNVYTFSLGTYTDLGSLPLNVKLRTNNLDGGNNERKFCFSMAVLGDILAATDYGLLRNTDDDFQTYSQYRRFDLSQVRSNQQRWGNYRRRAWEWRYTGTSQFRLQYLEPDIKQGVS